MRFIKDTVIKEASAGTNRQFALFFCPSCKNKVEKQKRLGVKQKKCGCSVNYVGKVINGFEIIVDYGGTRRLVLANCPVCGNPKKILFQTIKSKNSKSCGCLLGKHTTHNMSRTNLYSRWNSMKQRCFNPKHPSFKNYGGRGITVCSQWVDDFNVFYKWSLKNGFKENLSIDRENNDLNYTPKNCRWTTREVQSRNTRILSSNNKTGFRGVSFDKDRCIYVSKITVSLKSITIGYGASSLECAIEYDRFVRKNNLEHTLNFKKSFYLCKSKYFKFTKIKME